MDVLPRRHLDEVEGDDGLATWDEAQLQWTPWTRPQLVGLGTCMPWLGRSREASKDAASQSMWRAPLCPLTFKEELAFKTDH